MEAGNEAWPTGRSLSITEASNRLYVSRRTIYNYIRSGHLRTKKLKMGGQRIVLDDLYDLLLCRLGEHPFRRIYRVRGNQL